MKMSAEHYTALETAIKTILDNGRNSWSVYKDRGLSEERFRWDMLHASGFKTQPLYNAGLNDNHISTALRKICKPYIS